MSLSPVEPPLLPAPMPSARWDELRAFLDTPFGGKARFDLSKVDVSLSEEARRWALQVTDHAQAGCPLPDADLKRSGDSWLHRAVRFGHFRLARSLLDADADPNAYNLNNIRVIDELMGRWQPVGRSSPWTEDSASVLAAMVTRGLRLDPHDGVLDQLLLSLRPSTNDDVRSFLGSALLSLAHHQPELWDHPSVGLDSTANDPNQDLPTPRQALADPTLQEALGPVLEPLQATLEAYQLRQATAAAETPSLRRRL